MLGKKANQNPQMVVFHGDLMVSSKLLTLNKETYSIMEATRIPSPKPWGTRCFFKVEKDM